MISKQIRRIILEQSKRANVGHIGSALSVVEIIAVLYGKIINIPAPEDLDRDRFVLSKGHAALALYAALHLRGWISEQELNTYCGEGSKLGVHPEIGQRGIDFASGSLGQGLSIGAGAALAARWQGSKRRVYVLLSDAECNEGSTWEAVMFAAHHGLSNLLVVIDMNEQQALGYTKDILNLKDMAGRWKSFGWNAINVNGNDPQALEQAFIDGKKELNQPTVLIAKTIFGSGVSYMQNLIKWHYLPMSDAEYNQAINEVEE